MTLPKESGVYVVLRFAPGMPDFLVDNPMAWGRARAVSYPVQDLEKRWLKESPVVYIGVAAGAGGLDQRIRQFAGRNSSHSGGRSIWQLADSAIYKWRGR